MDKVYVYSYRYMWQLKDSSDVCFKIVTDTEKGLSEFEDHLLAVPGLERCCKEYISQVDCSLMGIFTSLLNDNNSLEVK